MEEVMKNGQSNKDSNNNSTTENNNTFPSNSNSLSIEDKYDRKIIKNMSEFLADICKGNTKDFKNENNIHMKPFLSRNVSISIEDYFERLCKYSKINSSTKILVLIYIDRLCNLYKVKLSFYNIHKLLLASMLVASKYNEDENYFIWIYAKIGGVTKAELSNLEYHFLSLLNFNLFVTEELFNKYNDYISSTDSDDDEFDYDNDD